MSDLDFEEDKIPFDNEPIDRRPTKEVKKESRPPKKGSAFGGVSKSLLYVVCAVFAGAFFIMSYLIVDMRNSLLSLESERNSYTMNISSEGGNTSFAATKGMLSTVSISASSTNNGGNAENFFSSAMASRGSGVIMEVNKEKGDAYIVTNFHVVCSLSTLKSYNYCWVLLWDSINPIPATYVGGSNTYDIAVLKITGSEEIKNSACQSVSVGESSKVTFGEEVVAIGNSMARNLRATTGVVAVEEELMGTTSYSMFISHSADVNSGNSGGGLFNANGELIGIVNAKFRDVNESTGELIYDEVIHGMNYAIPSEIAFSVAKNIIRNNGYLLRPALGISLGNNLTYESKYYDVNEEGRGYTTYDLVVTKQTGKFRLGDRLLSMSYEFEGKTKTAELNRLFSLESNIFNLEVGDAVTFKVDGREFTLTIESATKVS